MVWFSPVERIARTEKLINTVLKDDELLAAGRSINLDETALAHGTTLVAAARAADTRQQELDGAWQDIRTARKALRDAVVPVYAQQRRVAKLSIESATLRELLDIAGERITTVVEQHAQMVKFYANGLSNAAALKELNRIGITREMLEIGRTKLAQISALVEDEQIAKGKKEAATDARDAALDALDIWHDTTLKGLEFATREQPELMKRLGE